MFFQIFLRLKSSTRNYLDNLFVYTLSFFVQICTLFVPHNLETPIKYKMLIFVSGSNKTLQTILKNELNTVKNLTRFFIYFLRFQN